MRKIVRCVQIRLSEIFQVEIHQSSVIVLILFCKKAEFVVFVESRCRSKCIDCHKTASRPISMSKNIFHTIKDKSSDSISCIRLAYSQTSNFYCRIMIPLFAEWNLTIDSVTYAFLSFIEANHIVQQTIIGNDITILRVNKQVGDGKIFCLIIFGLIQQKFVQVTFGTLERSKVSFGCQHSNGNVRKAHRNNGQSGELRLNISYASRALSFSSEDAGDGWLMCQRKRSASLPVSTGVSLIGLAIINLPLLVFGANVGIISDK